MLKENRSRIASELDSVLSRLQKTAGSSIPSSTVIANEMVVAFPPLLPLRPILGEVVSYIMGKVKASSSTWIADFRAKFMVELDRITAQLAAGQSPTFTDGDTKAASGGGAPTAPRAARWLFVMKRPPVPVRASAICAPRAAATTTCTHQSHSMWVNAK